MPPQLESSSTSVDVDSSSKCLRTAVVLGNERSEVTTPDTLAAVADGTTDSRPAHASAAAILTEMMRCMFLIDSSP